MIEVFNNEQTAHDTQRVYFAGGSDLDACVFQVIVTKQNRMRRDR